MDIKTPSIGDMVVSKAYCVKIISVAFKVSVRKSYKMMISVYSPHSDESRDVELKELMSRNAQVYTLKTEQ